MSVHWYDARTQNVLRVKSEMNSRHIKAVWSRGEVIVWLGQGFSIICRLEIDLLMINDGSDGDDGLGGVAHWR